MWLYVPNLSDTSPSALEGADSILESSWQFQALVHASTWRGKPSPAPIWFRRWKKVSWFRRLCGAMPEPSTADAFVDAWTASLAEFRVKAIALPERNSDSLTSETSGRPPAASSSRPDHFLSSSKTSAACSARGLTKSLERNASGETYADWVSWLREDSSARRRSVRRMSASASSSSRWPTPDAQVMNDSEEPETFLARQAELKAKGINGNGSGLPLTVASKMWPTPAASETRQGFQQRPEGMASEQNQQSLTTIAMQWKTPRVERGGYTRDRGDPEKPRLTLEGQASVAQWPTPSVADTMGSRKTRSGDRSDEALLNGQAETTTLASILPDLPISTVGEESSHIRRSLNPLFVEWLMMWPFGWTELALTPQGLSGFGCSATVLSLFKQRSRSALSQFVSLPAPPAQLGLSL